MQPTEVRRRSPVHMEDVEDDDDFPHNVAPTNKSRILELSDGSDDSDSDLDMDDSFPPVVTEDEGDVEQCDDDEDVEEAEESAEAELGQ
jgi:hypothetical protein